MRPLFHGLHKVTEMPANLIYKLIILTSFNVCNCKLILSKILTLNVVEKYAYIYFIQALNYN
jgi:hypothetical protein